MLLSGLDDQEILLDSISVEEHVSGAAATPIIATFGASEFENGTRYLSVGGAQWPLTSGLIATADQYWPVPAAGTVTRLQIQFSRAIGSTTGTITFTVRKRTAGSTSDTSMTHVITCSGVTGTLYYASITANSFAVADGDSLSIKVLDAGLSTGVGGVVATLTLTPS